MAQSKVLVLGGDVMLGRGVDQILPRPGDPRLWERYVQDARQYVELAESINGPIPRPADFDCPWGDAIRLLDDLGPSIRVLNLETSITTSDDVDLDKGVHYRMHPGNVPCLAAIRPDVCTLANNHILDFGRPGLEETLATLARAGLVAVGTGRDRAAAARPAIIDLRDGRRLVVFAVGTPSGGVPNSWGATNDRPGIWLLPDPADPDVILDETNRWRRPGDVVVLSIHWGTNWGYGVPRAQTRLAHELIDGGIDVVFGHSSHHPRPIEIYQGKLVLYGCGDLVDDYEGIRGHERYRDDLRLLYIVDIDAEPHQLRMATMQSHQMRLRHASPEDAEWMRATLDRISRPHRSRIELGPDDLLRVRG